MHRAGHLGDAGGVAEQTAGQDHLLLVRAEVLAGVPFVAMGEVKDRNLVPSVLEGGAAVFGHLRRAAQIHPVAGSLQHLGFDLGHGVFLLPELRFVLTTHGSHRHRVLAVGVGEVTELGHLFRFAEGNCPFVVLGIDDPLHVRLELGTDAQRIFDDDLLQFLHPAFEIA